MSRIGSEGSMCRRAPAPTTCSCKWVDVLVLGVEEEEAEVEEEEEEEEDVAWNHRLSSPAWYSTGSTIVAVEGGGDPASPSL